MGKNPGMDYRTGRPRLIPKRFRMVHATRQGTLFADSPTHARARAAHAPVEVGDWPRELLESLIEGFAVHEVIQNEHGLPVDCRFLYVNHAFERMTGLSKATVVGRLVSEVLPGTESTWIELAGEVGRTRRQRRVKLSCAPLHRTLDVVAFSPRRGQFATLLTEPNRGGRGEVEDEAGGSFKTFADAMPQPVWSARPNGEIDYCNARCIEYLDIEKGADGLYSWQAAVYPEDRAATCDAWRHANEKGSVFESEHRLKCKDGAYRWHVSRATPIRDASGRVVKWHGSATEVDALKSAERGLRESECRLIVEDRRKSDFLAVLSHELRNPLAPIRNGLHVLERTAPGSPQYERARTVIRRQLDHVVRLVDDLLDVTRIRLGKIVLERSRLDAREIARRACEDARSVFEDRGVALRVDLPAEAVWLDADPTRLAQIVGNLLHNAAKFTPPGGAVDVVLRRLSGMAELSVRDSGIGIEPADLPRIFEPFAQAEGPTPGVAHGGIGLGLALVRSLAELHGGKVRAKSEGRGQGAELAVSLPLATLPREETQPPVDGAPVGAEPIRIVLVEDNVDAGETLSDLLELEGHEVHLVGDGPAALEAVATLHPHILVCDVGLPGMSGYDVVKAVRAKWGRNLYAVALTGYAQPEDRDRALAAGFDAHLAKPPQIEVLRAHFEQARERPRS